MKFLVAVVPEMHQLWGSSFFGNCFKFNIDFKNAKKKWKKGFGFEIIASESAALNCLY